MTKREAAIVAAYTGVMIGEFQEMHQYIEEIMGRPIQTFELGLDHVFNQIKEKSREDFKAIQVHD